jgi:hypothetical protein
LKATIPVIASITTTDPNGSGPARPNTQILVAGSGFSPNDEVHIIINGKDTRAEHAASDLNTDGQIVVTVPDATGFANPIQAPVYVQNAQGTSARFSMTLAPEWAPAKVLNLNELTSVLRSDNGGRHYGTGWEEFTVLSDNDLDIYHQGWVFSKHLASVLWGFKGDDTYFNNFQLKNNWTVKEVLFNSKTDAVGWAGVSLVETGVGTPSLHVKVHWWNEPYLNLLSYHFTYIIEGPKGTDYK